MNLIEMNIDKIRGLCSRYKVRSLFVFGSALTESFGTKSDIDMVVDFQEVDLYDYADNYFDLKESLEELFKREVDLLEEKAISNPYLKKSIDLSKQLLYG